MVERDAVITVLLALGAMVAVGALLPVLVPGLIHLLDRTVLEERDTGHH